MATFKAVILKNKVRRDGKYNVKIRVTHERKVSYIATPWYVDKSKLTKEKEIKDRDTLKATDIVLEKYESALLRLGMKIYQMNAQELADWLVKDSQVIEIDFAEFSQAYIDGLVKQGKTGNAEQIQAALNAFILFFKRDKISITEITSERLFEFERFLREDRATWRETRSGVLKEHIIKGLGARAIHDKLTRIRQLFLAAKDKYNDDDLGIIKIYHDPFKKYRMPMVPDTEKRNLEPEQIILIRDVKDLPSPKRGGVNKAEIGQDAFMMSFYLVGINSADLYNATEFKKGRLNYNRTKSKTRRKDEAWISIKAEPEVLPYFEKYKDPDGKRVFDFYKRFRNFKSFNKAINEGLKILALEINKEAELIEPDLEYYYARGSWSTIAKNKCEISTDNIAFALNHVVKEHEITNIYIQKDFSRIDKFNRMVLDKLLKL